MTKGTAPWDRYPGFPERLPARDYKTPWEQRVVEWSDEIISPQDLWKYTWAFIPLRKGREDKPRYYWVWSKKHYGMIKPKAWKKMHPSLIKTYTDEKCYSLVQLVMANHGEFGPSCQGHFLDYEAALRDWKDLMDKRVLLRRGKPIKISNPWIENTSGGPEKKPLSPIRAYSEQKGPTLYPRAGNLFRPAYNRFQDFYADIKKNQGKGAFMASFQTVIPEYKDDKKTKRFGHSFVKIEISLQKRVVDTDLYKEPRGYYAMSEDKRNWINRFKISITVNSKNEKDNSRCWEWATDTLADWIKEYQVGIEGVKNYPNYPRMPWERSVWEQYGEPGRKLARKWKHSPWYEEDR